MGFLVGNRVLMKRKSQKVSILGTIYKVEFRTEQEDPILSDCFGYVTDEFNMIVIDNLRLDPKWKDETDLYINSRIKKTLRHEVIHAFLKESGLDHSANSVDNWAKNEEMVDWLALQSPKIFKVYKELKCL